MKIKLGDLRRIVREVAAVDSVDEGVLSTARAAVMAALLSTAASAGENPNRFDTITAAADGDEDPDVVEIEDEDGGIHYFEVVLELDVDGRNYAVLELKDPGTPPEESLYIFSVSADGSGEKIYDEVTDNATWERVRAAAEEILNSGE